MTSVARRVGLLEIVLAVVVLVGGSTVTASAKETTPSPFYTEMSEVPLSPAPPTPIAGAATGTYTWDCGRNEQGHRNTANVVVTPGDPGPAHHVHDYVGNLGVQDDSTVDSIVGAPTTCTNGDDSTYYWPVLRYVIPGQDPHVGPIQLPVALTMEYLGNPRGPVLPTPRLLRGTEGDAVAYTNGGALARSEWTCTDATNRLTWKYPICDASADVVRILDFPSCWDGRRLDSPDHRAQLVYPDPGDGCPIGTFAVPHLRITITYDIPPGTRYQIDGFDGQANSPITDHAFMVNLMPDKIMNNVVSCLNTGRRCT